MKQLYIVSLFDGSEFVFEEFKLVEEFIKPLKNGSFYFRKVKLIENKQDLNNAMQILNGEQNQPQ